MTTHGGVDSLRSFIDGASFRDAVASEAAAQASEPVGSHEPRHSLLEEMTQMDAQPAAQVVEPAQVVQATPILPPVSPTMDATSEETEDGNDRVNEPMKAAPFLGWQGLLFRATGLRLSPSLKEQSLVEEALEINLWCDRNRLRGESVELMKLLASRVKKAAIAFVNLKGSAATTTTTVNCASVFSELTRVSNAVIDANPAEGTCAGRLGFSEGGTATTQELLDYTRAHLKKIREQMDLTDRHSSSIAGMSAEEVRELLAWLDHTSVVSMIRPSRYGTRVASVKSVVDDNSRISSVGMGLLLELLCLNLEFVFIDVGQDIGDAVGRKIAGMCDLVAYTANVEIEDTLRRLATSMETWRNIHPQIRHKVNNSVVLMSNLQPGTSPDRYQRYLNKIDFSDNITEVLEDQFDGRLVGVQHDPVIKKDGIVSIEAFQWQTMQDYVEAINAMLFQILVIRGEDVSDFVDRMPMSTQFTLVS